MASRSFDWMKIPFKRLPDLGSHQLWIYNFNGHPVGYYDAGASNTSMSNHVGCVV